MIETIIKRNPMGKRLLKICAAVSVISIITSGPIAAQAQTIVDHNQSRWDGGT